MFKFQKKAVAGIKAGNLNIIAAGRQTGKSTMSVGPYGATGAQGMSGGHTHSITGATGPMGASTNVATPKWNLLAGQFVLTDSWPQQRLKENFSSNDTDGTAWQKDSSSLRVRMSIPRFGERPWIMSHVISIDIDVNGQSDIYIDKSTDHKNSEWVPVLDGYTATVRDSGILAVFDTEDEANKAIEMLRLTDRAHDIMTMIFNAKQELLNHLHDGDIDNANNIANEYRKLLGKIAAPTKEFGTIVKLFAADS